MDFKPSNFCIMQNPTHIIGLDFDRNFIININQLQSTGDTLKRVAFTYMFVLAVLNLQYDMSPTEKAELQRLVRTRHLKATHISELIRTLVEFEKTGHNLCKTKYNPLSMLAYYVLPVVNINSADVLSCNMLAKPVSTFSKGFSKTTPTYDFVKTVIAENVFGLSEYNNEKNGANYLTNPFVSNDFELYMSRIKPLQIQPLIQVSLQTTEIPMFVQEQAQLPPSKKYRASAEGGAKPRNKQRSRQRSRQRSGYKTEKSSCFKKSIRQFTYKKYNSIL
jgi:hypothetical protein